VTDTYITSSNSGISIVSSGLVLAVIDHTDVLNVTANGITTGGATGIAINISNSHVASAGTAINAGGGGTAISVDSSTIEGNNIALNAAVSGAVIRASNNVIYGNSTNFAFTAGATIASSAATTASLRRVCRLRTRPSRSNRRESHKARAGLRIAAAALRRSTRMVRVSE
jgi:hypothetical protein